MPHDVTDMPDFTTEQKIVVNSREVNTKTRLVRKEDNGKSVTSASVLVAIYENSGMIDCKCLCTIPNEGYLLELRPCC
ncbi:hypothetical protein BTO10_02935 [Vibrio chagasii]|uniref:Uncharacterized protein n=1 Tax=Vibrio chagasii TaxID=170679 RepID=A0A2S7VPN1_9VIBR|nr:hypothetical protein BTO10_02935 [Vibrio chagasii]|tara:strand:+ start:154 stop:387 length:234 start_codon:yes stop_codon:yes gene_type:complete